MQPASLSLASHFQVALPGGQAICDLAACEGLQLPGWAYLFRSPGVIGAFPARLGLGL